MGNHEELDVYGDPDIKSGHAKVPGWLTWSYILLPIWGIVWFYFFWNGSTGWLDRGYWRQLQEAAGTTVPFQNFNDEVKEGNE